MKKILVFFLLFTSFLGFTQTANVSGTVKSENGNVISYATVGLEGTAYGAYTIDDGSFELETVPFGDYTIRIQLIGFESFSMKITVDGKIENIEVVLKESDNQIDEVVVSGTLKPVSKSKSPVPVEVYTKEFFKKNPTPSIFEALANVNGVRPQMNCNVCNTGDIHINGLE
ncbi:MAG: TonB-dependent receptor, partial [Flavobacteriales bacterium]|nr:TonB-dependent receptor [Flavobacteriales bacterium]